MYTLEYSKGKRKKKTKEELQKIVEKLQLQDPIFIVDPDHEFIQEVQEDPSAMILAPVATTSGIEAQATLSDKTKKFSGIFINPNVTHPGGLSVIRCAHLHHLGTPIYILHDGKVMPYSEKQLRGLAVQDVLEKPITYTEMAALVAPLVAGFDADGALERASRNEDPLLEEFSARDIEFTPVHAETFVSGNRCFFDVYIRLRSGRYIKLVNAGDQFDPEQLGRYIKKGVSHFYLRKEVQAHYLTYCDHLTSNLIGHKEAPQEAQQAHLITQGEETMKFLKVNGVNDENLEHASKFVWNTLRYVRTVRLERHKQVAKMMNDIAAREHGVAVAIVASMIARPFNLESEKIKRVIGLASMLHDIGLTHTAPHLVNKSPSELSIEEKAIYITHPRVGANLLRQIRGIDLTIIQAIEQHHERRDGKGFPNKAGPGSISRIAEIIGIADEFVDLIVQAGKDPEIQPLLEMEKKFNGFSYPVIEAFKKVFIRDKK